MKSGQKILIASGGLLLAGGIAYAVSPTFRSAVKGLIPGAILSEKQKVQREISRIITGREFVNGNFINAAYLDNLEDANISAKKFIYSEAITKLNLNPVGMLWGDFDYSGLSPINIYFWTHVNMQRFINRILNTTEWNEWANMTIARPHTDMNEARQDIFNAALDSTKVDAQYAGGPELYYYATNQMKSRVEGITGQPTEIAWYKTYFLKGVISSAMGSGGNNNSGGNTSGGSSGNESGTGGGLNFEFQDIVEGAQDLYCEIFGCDPDTGGIGGGGVDFGGDPCAGGTYDPLTGTCGP